MIVLGIHFGHDSSCAVVKDGQVIADAQEERFTRVKHCANVPTKSLAYCIKASGVSDVNEFDLIAYGGTKTPSRIETLLGLPPVLDKRRLVKQLLSYVGIQLGNSTMKPPVYMPDYTLKDVSRFHNVEHHLAHAAAAHYTRRTAEECLVFTIDGFGDGVSTAVWLAEGNKIKPLEKLFREASIGWAYSVVTEGLHWWHGDGEGKTMGLAPYGDPNKCQGILDHLFPKINGHNVKRPGDLLKFYTWDENGATQWHCEIAKDVEKLCDKYGRENIAAEAQRKLEECVMNYVFGWVRKTGIRRTAYSGGVLLNVKLNQRIWNARDGLVDEQHVFPNCGDGGLAVGSALEVYYRHHEFNGTELNHLYWGPEWSNKEIEKILESRGLKYKYVEDPPLEGAKLLADGKIIGWFQGRMESGPRALGNRSILMSPCKSENKDIINAKVKYREAFRPFCPSILYESRDTYLDDARDEFFMITSFDVKRAQRDKMPAVVHVDGTVRPQMVKNETNERYWRLINEFGNRTGIYAILNTSMNVKGEPIVNSPSDAIRCFYDTGIESLILGNFVLSK